jgi:glyceraldehyde-3-phosphate dehydrogenase/erythrose-4-phosphate dehydrogenase
MKIAINGFGRIGRIFFRQAFDKKDFQIVTAKQNSVCGIILKSF